MANQPVPQPPTVPSQATRVLFHILWSLLAAAFMAGATTGANYLYTGGSSINLTVVGSAAASAFFIFLVTHAPSVLKTNEAPLLAGMHDLLIDAHQPILTYLAQLLQQTSQIQQVASATFAQVAPSAPASQPAPLPISQQATANMPALPSGGGTSPTWYDQYKVTGNIPTVQR